MSTVVDHGGVMDLPGLPETGAGAAQASSRDLATEPLFADGAVLAVTSITVTSGKVAAIYVVLNPDKLRHVNSASLHEPS